MIAFVALYEGQTANGASLVALSSDERLVGDVARRLVWEREPAVRPYLEKQKEKPRRWSERYGA